MSSNTTPNYGLPQYAANDHPDFLTEINEAYKTIDTVLNTLSVAETNNHNALQTLSSTVETLAASVADLATRVQALENGGTDE